jgi:hypothetical protein
MLAAIVPAGPDNLFFAGDLGQRIFQPPFSWLSQGVDVRGRSTTLKVNYRTSHQIRRRADLLLALRVRDVEGLEEGRKGTISVFEGSEPDVRLFENDGAEIAFVGAWIAAHIANGVAPGETASASSFGRAVGPRESRGEGRRAEMDAPDGQRLRDRRPRRGRRDAAGEGAGGARRRGYGVRQRGDPAAITNPVGCRGVRAG